jgi:hypothetical protein
MKSDALAFSYRLFILTLVFRASLRIHLETRGQSVHVQCFARDRDACRYAEELLRAHGGD